MKAGLPPGLELLIVASIVIAATFVGPALEFDYAVPVSVVVAVIVVTFLQRAKGQSWRELGLSRPESAGVLAGWTAAIVVTVFVSSFLIVNLLTPALDLQKPELARFEGIRDDPALLLVWLVPVAWGAAAFGEEMLMRGFLMNRIAAILGGGRGAWVGAVVLQAVLFGIGHAYQGVTGVLATTSIGLIMGFAFLLNGRNLWPLILAHGTIDTIGLLAIYKGYF